ncbi:unnamed protein product [Schistosoma rodhaini]|uniref:Uncharacterized protein n=1 Tax=Schistosoma rodhaini TaxID=6188 RepID=A0AA85FYD7_9TREM|nr:unnamed protein product [Schistosoma rodhaini]
MYLLTFSTKLNYVQIVDGTKYESYSMDYIKGRLKRLRDNLKKVELVLYKSEEELKKQIDITVRVSSTLRRCFNSESFSLYEVSQIIALIFKKDEITRNYNKHLWMHRLLINIANEDNR